MRLATCNQQQLGIVFGSEAMMQADCICKGWYICELGNQTGLN